MTLSCSDTKPSVPDPLPEEEVGAYREAVSLVSKYVVLKDSAYHLSITKDKAVELGVPPKYYDRIMQDLEYTNYLIEEEYNKKGIPVELTDFVAE